MAFDQSKFLARFIEDAREHINEIYEGLFSLEKNPEDEETLNSIFRSAHTIKGTSRMMKLPIISEVAHKVEDVLSSLREKKIQHSKDLSDLLIRGTDAINDMIEKVAAGNEISMVYEELCETLENAASGEYLGEAPIPKKSKSSESETEHKTTSALETEKTQKDSEEKEMTLSGQPASVEPLRATQKTAPETKKPKISETIRITADKLDGLINLVGEMLSNHYRFKQRLFDIRDAERLAKKSEELLSSFENGNGSSGDNNIEIIHTYQSLQNTLRHLSLNFKDDFNMQELLTGELQESALKMRMLPLSVVFNALQRTARDISNSFGKEIDFIIEGGETELDKKMIENIGDPLIHMIRNSIDHGIENPEERLEVGKAEKGVVKLSAYYEGSNVLIELSDDGRGISLEKIKEKAIQKKMFDKDTLNIMPESQVIDLIFYPGFSTSPIITDISGRGVGMDVVRKNIIEDLKGSIQVETQERRGTTFYIRLPLTLAIMRVLLVVVSDLTYAIPSNYVKEVLVMPKEEVINVLDKRAIRLREEIVPISNLIDLLKLPDKDPVNHKELSIILTHVGDEKLGLVVDSLIDEEDMVIKPLPSHMKSDSLVSGVVITGDNVVVNVLNIPGIRNAAKEKKDVERFKIKEGEEKKEINVLVVDDSITTREMEKSILEAYGYTVNLAGDGMEALEKVKELEYDLIVTDIEMPRMDGFSLTRELRKDDDYKDTPIIIVTSREKEEDKRRGIEVGADAYIIKGTFDQSNLLNTVQNLVGQGPLSALTPL